MEMPPSILSELPALLVIAEECHFGRAAERLNVSQPRVSQIVLRIEDLVGFRIFIRRPQVRLTAAGEALIKTAGHALGGLADGLVRASDVAAGRLGTVRLGYSPVAMLTPLPSFLKTFRSKNPGVSLSLQEHYSAHLWAALEAGQLDVIVSREARDRAGIRNSPFYRDGLMAVLPADDPLSDRTQLHVTDLKDKDFVAIDESISPQRLGTIMSFCRSAAFEPRIVQRVNDWAAILALVASGIGVSIVSSTLAQLKFPGVKFMTLEGGAGAGAFWVSSRDEAIDPAVSLLCSVLINEPSETNLPG